MLNTELRTLITDAEDCYLQSMELQKLQRHIRAFGPRIEAYEVIRSFELEVFQAVADDLQSSFARLDGDLINRVLTDGLAILRYGSMAMLQDNPDHLQRQVLDCLPDRVAAYDLGAATTEMLRLLQVHLNKRIASSQVSLLQPYLDQAQRALATVPVLAAA